LQRLQPFLEQGWPLLGAEPSCLLTFVDEYPDLVPSNAAQTAARNAFLVEDWLLQQGVVGPLSSTGAKIHRTILLHGHCQQRALVGLQGTRALLKQLPGAPLVEPDAGCCGMAGAFGYEHFDVSQQIGERVLFPAVRQHDGPVAAPGFSCRHQIREATGVQPVHPLELLAAAWGAAGTRSE
jgi:Fe-S oxidoreductase